MLPLSATRALLVAGSVSIWRQPSANTPSPMVGRPPVVRISFTRRSCRKHSWRLLTPGPGTRRLLFASAALLLSSCCAIRLGEPDSGRLLCRCFKVGCGWDLRRAQSRFVQTLVESAAGLAQVSITPRPVVFLGGSRAQGRHWRLRTRRTVVLRVLHVVSECTGEVADRSWAVTRFRAGDALEAWGKVTNAPFEGYWSVEGDARCTSSCCSPQSWNQTDPLLRVMCLH